jgi:hypothetical protein
MVGLPSLASQCAKLHVAGWTWAVSHAFSGEVYDFYSVSPEYFGYTLVSTVFEVKITRTYFMGY